MNVELSFIKESERQTFLNLYQFYIYEFTSYFDTTLNERGLYNVNSSQFDKYWGKSKHWPYFIRVDKEIAGFCLLRRYSYTDDAPEASLCYDIEQFFILNQFKRKGVGIAAFNSLMKFYPGRWQIRVMATNLPALQFWEKCISNFTEKRTRELKLELGINMYFLKFG